MLKDIVTNYTTQYVLGAPTGHIHPNPTHVSCASLAHHAPRVSSLLNRVRHCTIPCAGRVVKRGIMT